MRVVSFAGLGLLACVAFSGGSRLAVSPLAAATLAPGTAPSGAITAGSNDANGIAAVYQASINAALVAGTAQGRFVGLFKVDGAGHGVVITDAGTTIVLKDGWQSLRGFDMSAVNKRATVAGFLLGPTSMLMMSAVPTPLPTPTPTPAPTPTSAPIAFGSIRVAINVLDARVVCGRLEVAVLSAEGASLKTVTGLSASPIRGQCYETIEKIPLTVEVVGKAPQPPVTYRPTTPLHVVVTALDLKTQIADTHVPTLTPGTIVVAPTMTANTASLKP